MNKYLKTGLWILVFAVLIAGAAVAYNMLSSYFKDGGADQTDEESNTDENTENNTEGTEENTDSSDSADAEKTPDFTVYDSEGNIVKLSDFSGRPVVINFWATWCPYCVKELPDFQTVYNDYSDDVVFMFIDMTDGSRETQSGAESFISEKGYTFPVYFDIDYSAADAFSVYSLPQTYFIGADGKIADVSYGMTDGDTLRTKLDALLS